MFFHPISRTRTQFLLIAAATATAAAAALFFYSTHQARINKKKREKEQEQERQKNPIYQAKEYVKKRTAEFKASTTNTLIRIDQNKNRTIDPIFYNIDAYRQSLEDPKNNNEKQWRSRVLVEYTPLGNIIMNYDVYRAGFAYYSDNNSLNYDLLNAVAMKYVKIFHCLDFFMDETFYDSPLFDVFYTEKKEDDDTAAANNATEDKKNTIDSNDDVFLKKPQPQSDPKKQHRKTQHKKRVNKFVKQGKIENFSFLVKPPKRPVFSVNKDDDEDTFMQNLISYADYKNRQKKLPPVVEDEVEDDKDEDYIPNIIDI